MHMHGVEWESRCAGVSYIRMMALQLQLLRVVYVSMISHT